MEYDDTCESANALDPVCLHTISEAEQLQLTLDSAASKHHGSDLIKPGHRLQSRPS